MANKHVIETKRNIRVSHIAGKGKVAQSFPPEVREAIVSMAGEYTKSITLTKVTPQYNFYVAEGGKYRVIHNEEQRGLEVADGNTMHAAGNMEAIGTKFNLPVGTWLIERTYYQRYWITVYNVQPEQIEESKAVS